MATLTTRSGISLGMRLLALFLICLCLDVVPAAAQTSLPDLSNLSTCSLSCLAQGISVSGCSPIDIGCQCSSKVMLDTTTACVVENCTMQDGLDVARTTAASCNLPSESQATELLVAVAILFGVSFLFVVLRTASKLMTKTFCTEDHVVIAGLLLALVPVVSLAYMAHLGFGRHIWDLEDGALTKILQMFYVAEIFYIATLMLTKISLVCMYLRIFWTYLPFKLACYGALVFIILPSGAILLVTILSCQPIAFFWDRDIPHGTCVDVSALAYANSAFAVAQDAALIVLPVFMLWSLNMSRRKKVLIGSMFAVGSLSLVATIIRLRTLYVFGDLSDPTWDYVPVVYWTTIELAAGIIASCMPAVRKLLEQCFGIFHIGTTLHRSVSGSDMLPGSVGLRQQHIGLERRRWPTARGARDPMALPDLESCKDDVWEGSSQRELTSPGYGDGSIRGASSRGGMRSSGLMSPKMMIIERVETRDTNDLHERDQ